MDILAIVASSRRAGSVKVDTKIRAKDASAAGALAAELGDSDALMGKLNQNLQARGLKASTGVSAPAVAVVGNTLPSEEDPKTKGGLSSGAIAGIGLGGAAGVGVVAAAFYYGSQAKQPSTSSSPGTHLSVSSGFATEIPGGGGGVGGGGGMTQQSLSEIGEGGEGGGAAQPSLIEMEEGGGSGMATLATHSNPVSCTNTSPPI